jgi:hypothetical protein
MTKSLQCGAPFPRTNRYPVSLDQYELIIVIDETGHYKPQPVESHPAFGSRICPTFKLPRFQDGWTPWCSKGEKEGLLIPFPRLELVYNGHFQPHLTRPSIPVPITTMLFNLKIHLNLLIALLGAVVSGQGTANVFVLLCFNL